MSSRLPDDDQSAEHLQEDERSARGQQAHQAQGKANGRGYRSNLGNPGPPKRQRAGPANRCRAARACQKCNEKRVKCDASAKGTPCTRCIEKGEIDCKMIKSRRGTYARKLAESRQRGEEQLDEHQQSQGDSDTAMRGPATEQPGSNSPAVEKTGDDGPQRRQPSLPSLHVDDQSSPRPVVSDRASSHSDPLVHDQGISPASSKQTDASSTAEKSWATLFSHLLEDHDKGLDIMDKGSITYLGESFPLSFILKDLAGSSGWRQLHHSGPPCPPDEEESRAGPKNIHPPYMRPEDISYLSSKGAFEIPKEEVLDGFVDVFLDRVYPLYPIVNRLEFRQQRQSKRIPWILLHAVCLAAATFCPIQTIHQAGFESRRVARWSFYSKAKALFDLSYESNKIVALQVTILMTFWGGGPNTYWNFYSWVSTAVTIAETLGCHRTMAGTNIKPHDRSLLKRLWWVLLIRDTACAALVGRPFRINMDHCDLDHLVMDDFEQDVPTISRLYQIEAAKLSLILRNIIMTRFSARRDPSLVPMSLHYMLTDWRCKLPAELGWSDNCSRPSNVLSACLAVTYNHHMILAHLGCPPNPMQPDQPSSEDLSSLAAQQIASISCGVVTRHEILTAPHEFLHGIFTAAVVFYKQTKSQHSLIKQLGMAGLTNCQMVLHDTYESWDPSPWVQHILNKITRRRSEDTYATDMSKDGTTQPVEPLDSASCLDAYEPILLDQNLVSPQTFNLWQSYPVLGDLFDLAPSDQSASGAIAPITPYFGDEPSCVSWV